MFWQTVSIFGTFSMRLQSFNSWPETDIVFELFSFWTAFSTYSENEVNDKVNFLHSDKHESVPQIGTMVFAGDGQIFPKFPK